MIAWKILRSRFWVLGRRLRHLSPRSRIVALGGLLLLSVGGGWGYGKLVGILSTEQGSATSSSIMPMILLLLLFFALMGLGDTLHRLYLASDLELLMVAPVPYRAIFAIKVLECSRAVWLPGAFLSVILIALGDAQGAPVTYYPLVVSLLLLAMVLVTTLGMGLMILLARLIPPQRVQQWIPAAIGLVSVGFLLGQQAMMDRIAGWTEAMVFLARILLDPGQLTLAVIGLGASAVIGTLAVFQLFERAFYRGWNSFQEAPVRRIKVSAAARRRGWFDRLTWSLPTPLRHHIVKEWRTVGRDVRRLTAMLLPPLMMGVLLFPCLGTENPYRVLVFWILLLYGSGFALNSTLGIALPAVGQEGRNIALLRSAPLSMKAVLSAKFWSMWIPNFLVWSLAFLTMGGLARMPIWQILFLIGGLAWGLAGASAAAVAIGALGADFTTEDPRRRVGVLAGWLALGLGMIFLLLNVLTISWLGIHLYPRSEMVLASRRALEGFSIVGWLFTEEGWAPWPLGIGQMAYWAGMRALWSAAVRRLENWEEI